MERAREKPKICSVPVQATITVDRKTGEIIERQYEMADIPANALAAFFLDRFGVDREEVEMSEEAREA